jgi:hypothetical protein
VSVNHSRTTALAAQQLVDRHAGLASFDVPKRLIDTADGIIEDRTIAPVRGVVHGLPQVFNAIGWFAQEEGLQIAIDCLDNQLGALCECRAAVSVETILIGQNFDHDQPYARGRGCDNRDVFDFRHRHAAQERCSSQGKKFSSLHF